MYPGDIGAAANTTAGGGMADGRTMTTSIASSSLATDGYKLMAIDVLDHRGVDAAAAAPGSALTTEPSCVLEAAAVVLAGPHLVGPALGSVSPAAMWSVARPEAFAPLL